MRQTSSGVQSAPRPASVVSCHIGVVVAVLALACAPSDATREEVVRGRGLSPTTLGAAEQAAALSAALRSAFDVGPSLILVLDPTLLPRTRGYVGRDTLAISVQRALRESGLVHGGCTPIADDKRAPICEAAAPGYIVRMSEPLRMAGDSLLLHLMAERFDTRASGRHPRFRFETAYQLVKRGKEWTVARQARLPSS